MTEKSPKNDELLDLSDSSTSRTAMVLCGYASPQFLNMSQGMEQHSPSFVVKAYGYPIPEQVASEDWNAAIFEVTLRTASAAMTHIGRLKAVNPSLIMIGVSENSDPEFMMALLDIGLTVVVPRIASPHEAVKLISNLLGVTKSAAILKIQNRELADLLAKHRAAKILLEHQLLDTQRVEAERDSAKASLIDASKLATLGEMAAGVAHEINNPLAIIQGAAERVAQVLSNSAVVDMGKIAEYNQRIIKNVGRITRTVNGLKTFSRQNASDPKQPAALDQIMADCLELCNERIKNHGIEFRVEAAPSVFLECWPGQLAQVVLNLVNNAHDAVRNLNEPWVHLGFSIDGDYVKLKVTDSGSGLPESLRQKIFDPFFTTKPVGQGTGLGLSISKKIVEHHGGTLSLDSSSPNTCFVVSLPILKQAAA